MDGIDRTANTSDPVVHGFLGIRFNGDVQKNYWPDKTSPDIVFPMCRAYMGKRPTACGPHL